MELLVINIVLENKVLCLLNNSLLSLPFHWTLVLKQDNKKVRERECIRKGAQKSVFHGE